MSAVAEWTPELYTAQLDSVGSEVPFDWPHRDRSFFFETSSCRWHLQRMGQGETVLLLHGTAASTHSWRDVMPILATRFDVVAIDLPGHGFTHRLNSAALTLDAIGDSVTELLDALDIRPRHVIGHSAGAAIAIDMSLRGNIRPDRIAGVNAALLPFGGALRSVFSPMARFFANTRLMPSLLSRRARDPRAIERVLRGTGSMLDDEARSYYQQLFRRELHLAAVLDMMANWDLEPLIRDLSRLEAELLLVVGMSDQAVSPRESGKIQQAFPETRICKMDGLGHLAHEEAPDGVSRIVMDFLEHGAVAA